MESLKWTIQFQHSAARRRLCNSSFACVVQNLFQHSAARRRLKTTTRKLLSLKGFNTQPPEGG